MTGANVLIVEDEGILAIGLKKKLERLGYNISAVASSGEEAIELAVKQRPDLILMDIVLKGEMDGIEAASKIHSILQVPIIYLTAYADEDTVKRAKISEPFGYLIKPYNDKELQIAMEMALYRHEMEKLKESHHWLETVLTSIGDAVIVTDINGRVNFINPSGEKLTGWKHDDALGKSLEEIVTIIDEDAGVSVNHLVGTALSERGSSTAAPTGINELITRDGRGVPIEYTAATIVDVKGEVMGVVLIIKDLTSQKQAELQSKIREVAMASSVNAICITDINGMIKYANGPFYELWGYESGEVIGKLASEICQIDAAISEIEGVLREIGKWDGEMAATKRDGAKLFVRLSINNIGDRLGKPAYVVYSFVDITSLKMAKEELKKYISKLQRTDVEADEIAEELSRNFNLANESIQRLNTIVSKNQAGEDDEVAKCLADTRGHMDRVAGLIERLERSNLPLSFYISLIGLYQLKVEDFDESREAQVRNLQNRV